MGTKLTKDDIKRKVGDYAAALVPANAIIGLGTGTTVFYLIKELGRRVEKGLSCRVVPTSLATKKLAEEVGLTVIDLNDAGRLVMTIDGADEADTRFNLIKGGGGALLMEKMVAAASDQLIIIVDEAKNVKKLGAFPLPVEVIRAGWKQVEQRILELGCPKVTLRMSGEEILVTDNGHYILDCHYAVIDDPAALNMDLHLLPGVVETGLFIDMADVIITGYMNGDLMVDQRS